MRRETAALGFLGALGAGCVSAGVAPKDLVGYVDGERCLNVTDLPVEVIGDEIYDPYEMQIYAALTSLGYRVVNFDRGDRDRIIREGVLFSAYFAGMRGPLTITILDRDEGRPIVRQFDEKQVGTGLEDTVGNSIPFSCGYLKSIKPARDRIQK